MNNVVTTLASLFLIVSFSCLQVTRTTIKSPMASIFGNVRPGTSELPLSVWKNPQRLIKGEIL